MTAEELEELLSPQVAPVSLPFTSNPSNRITLTPMAYTTASTSSFAPGFFVNQSLGVIINSGQHDGHYSNVYNERVLTAEDKKMIMRAALAEVNSFLVRGARLEEGELQGYSRRISHFVETYMYRWFPNMIHPKIECIVSISPHDRVTEMSVRVNDLCIGAIGMRT